MLTGLWSQRCRVARMAECIQRPQRGIEISRHGDFCGSDSGQYCGALYLRGGGGAVFILHTYVKPKPSPYASEHTNSGIMTPTLRQPATCFPFKKKLIC